VNDRQQSAPRQPNGFRELFESNGDFAEFDALPSATDTTAGLVSLGFIGSALRRSMTVWIVVALIGLVIGSGLAVLRQPASTATATLLLDTTDNAQGKELPTDIAIAESTPVAAAVIAQLGIQQTPTEFLQTYTVTIYGLSAQVLTLSAKGPSDAAAVQRASAIADQFLAFRAKYLQGQMNEAIDALNNQVAQAQQNLATINQQIAQVSAQAPSPSQQTQLAKLQKQQTSATNTLSAVQQDATDTKVQDEAATGQMVRGSEVLSAPTPVKHSSKKSLALYAIAGLIGGLVVGMAIVIIGSITTDRLRRRDDIAIAVGAPVRLSVGRLRQRRMFNLRKKSGQRNRDMKRFVEHLRKAVPADSGGAAGLAVVTIDDAPSVAQAIVKLAIVSAQQGRRVVLADLSVGAPAARALGVTAHGINVVSPDGVPIAVVVPEAEDVAPVGPLGNGSTGSAKVSEELAETYTRADLVLSIVTLNPAFGGDYLGTWATDAVAVVTAGQSNATRIHSAGEMIRLAGVQLASVVVLDVDQSDESLGTVIAEYQPAAAVR
jgi:capsular polysaccharide biosynthesis protein